MTQPLTNAGTVLRHRPVARGGLELDFTVPTTAATAITFGATATSSSTAIPTSSMQTTTTAAATTSAAAV